MAHRNIEAESPSWEVESQESWSYSFILSPRVWDQEEPMEEVPVGEKVKG